MQGLVKKVAAARQAAQEALAGLKAQPGLLPADVDLPELEKLLAGICAAHEEFKAGPRPVEPVIVKGALTVCNLTKFSVVGRIVLHT